MKERLQNLPERIEFVGTRPGPGWTKKLALGLGMSRSQLFEYRRENGKRDHTRDLDGELIDLIERERDAAAERGVELTQLRNHLLALVAKARKA